MLRAFWGLFFISIAGTYFALKNITYHFQDLLPETSNFKRSEKEARSRYPITEQYILRIRGPNPDANEAFTQALGEQLSQSEITEYQFKDATQFFTSHAAHYINPKYLEPILKPTSPQSSSPLKSILNWSSLLSTSGSNTRYLQMERGYFYTSDRSQYFIFIFPNIQSASYEQAKKIDTWASTIIEETKISTPAYSNIEVDRVGSLALVIAEHEAVFSDIVSSTIIILILIFALLFFYFQNITSVALALLPPLCGVVFAIVVSSPLLYPLNANSVFFLSVVLGNGINSAIIFLGRASELKDSTENWITQTVKETIRPTFVASFAAAAAYGALAISSFKGFFQIGVLGIVGMFLCWGITYFLLPRLLQVPFISSRFLAKSQPHYISSAFTLSHKSRKTYALLIAAISVLSVALLSRSDLQWFELNLDKLRAKTSIPITEIHFEIAKNLGATPNPIIVLAQTPEKACSIAKKIRAKYPISVREPYIKSSLCLNDLVPSEQTERLQEIRSLLKKYPLSQQKEPRANLLHKKLTSSLKNPPFSESDLPLAIQKRFTEKDGSKGKIVFIELTQDKHIWHKGLLFKIINEISDIVQKEDPQGVYISSHFLATELFTIMNQEGTKVIGISLFFVFLGVFFLLRKEKSTWFVLGALTLGMLWFFAFWLGFNLKIHFISFMAIPITLGVGVDYAINLYHRKTDPRIGATVVCCLTTIIGWGSFAIASSQALATFGTAAIIGEMTCLAAAVLVFGWIRSTPTSTSGSSSETSSL